MGPRHHREERSTNPAPNPAATSPKIEAKHLYRRLDAHFRSIERPAQEILSAVLKECETFGGPRPFEDDATLVIVKHATLPA